MKENRTKKIFLLIAAAFMISTMLVGCAGGEGSVSEMISGPNGGFMDILYIPLGFVIKFAYMLTPNYAIALLLFAIVMKIILFPLSIKQQKNSVKQASLRPKEMAIRKRYAGRTDAATQQKINEEIQKLYQSENFNPAGGCLPLLIQFPVMIALYSIIRYPLRYICGLSKQVIEAIHNEFVISAVPGADTVTSQFDLIALIKENFELIKDIVPAEFTLESLPSFEVFKGFDLSLTPSIDPLNLLVIVPVIVLVGMIISTKITRKFTYQPPQTGDAAMSMKIMDYGMPLLSAWMCLQFPAVIGVYWIYQTLLSMVQQIILAKVIPLPKFTDEDYKRIEKEMNGNIHIKKEKKKVRSLHNIDADDPSANTENSPEKTEEQKSSPVAKAAIKEDKYDNLKPKTEKKKVRSLHRIDEEDESPSDGDNKNN